MQTLSITLLVKLTNRTSQHESLDKNFRCGFAGTGNIFVDIRFVVLLKLEKYLVFLHLGCTVRTCI